MPGGAITGSQKLATSEEHPALAGGCFGDTAPSRNPVGQRSALSMARTWKTDLVVSRSIIVVLIAGGSFSAGSHNPHFGIDAAKGHHPIS